MMKKHAYIVGFVGLFFLLLGSFGCVAAVKTDAGWTQQCVIEDIRLNELSGLSESIRYPGYLWATNDSGDSLRCFLISPQGKTVASVNIKIYENIDVESLHVAGSKKKSWVYLGDTGDNRARRSQIEVYRFEEPEIDIKTLGQDIDVSAKQMVLTYDDGFAVDAETLLVGSEGYIGVVSKSFFGSELWVAEQAFFAGSQPLKAAGEVAVGEWKSDSGKYSLLITDGSISDDGSRLALMTYTHLFLWNLPPGKSIADFAKFLASAPDICKPLPELQQAEALSFAGEESDVIVVTSEGIKPPLMRLVLEAHNG